MRRRVMTVYVALMIIAGLGLAVPLCTTLAARASASMTADRTTDAARFAGLAETSVVLGAAGVMDSELRVYQELYGIQALVLDTDSQVVAASSPGLELTDLVRSLGHDTDVVPEVVRSAQAGTRIAAVDTIWPWQRTPLMVAEPVVSGGEVIGVVVTSSPVGALSREVALQWAVVLVGVILLLGAGALAAGPLTRWVLRPVAELDQAANEISGGRGLEVRVPSDTGPPELRHVARSFNRMASTITELLSRQRTFVAYAGHQVRNPLAALRIRVETLGLHLNGAAAVDHALALEEVDRLTRTCDSLITLAQADDDGAIELVAVQVQDVIAGRVRAWEPIADRAGARLVHTDGEPYQVQSIGGSIEQVLDALIDNAIKFGGPGVTVRIAAQLGSPDQSSSTRTGPEGTEAPRWLELTVQDDGPGLDAEQRRRAVRPFWRFVASGRDEGTGAAGPVAEAAGGSGLGLSVVVTLVELQGGELALTEPPTGQGMVARLRLPVGQPE